MTRPLPIDFICGLPFEAKILRRYVPAEACEIHVSNADPERTARLARQALERGSQGLVSFGIAGGLDPSLAPGTVIVPKTVVTEGGKAFAATVSWEAALLSQAHHCRLFVETGPLVGVAHVVETIEAKARLYSNHRAVAVDMESHLVAEAAAKGDAPFLAVRAVADSATHVVPPFARDAISPDGRTRVTPILVGIAKDVRALRDVVRLAHNTGQARRALSSVARDLLPALFRLLGLL